MRWAWSIRVGWKIRVETGQHALWRREILKLSGSGLPWQREQTYIYIHTQHTLTHCMNIHAYIVWQGSLSHTHKDRQNPQTLTMTAYIYSEGGLAYILVGIYSNPLRNKGRFQIRSLKALPCSLLSFLFCYAFPFHALHLKTTIIHLPIWKKNHTSL